MEIKFNAYGCAEPSVAYIAKPNYDKIGVLNGIQENSGNIDGGINTATLSFTVEKYIDGELSNYYDFIEKPMKIWISNIGWFTVDEVKTNNKDGKNESKDITIISIDQEFLSRDLVGFKINNGTTDSCEMLIDGNIEEIDGVEFAKKQITFHNADNLEFSLIQTVLNWTGMIDWTVGYIDPIPKEFTVYENGEYIKKMYTLSEQVGYFDISSENAYDFFVKEASKYFECVFIFDILNKKINAYYVDHVGKDTNIVLGWRNVQNSLQVDTDTNLFTRYTVQGGDELPIYFANFGSSQIENLDYFLNEKYMTPELIVKYKAWKADIESKRHTYINLTIKYNDNLETISELQDRVPLDGCGDDFSKFSDDELQAAKDGYDAQIVGYESFYIDDDGNFDIDKLMACESDWNEYCQIKDVILPNIEIEYYNRGLPTSEGEKDYLDSYKTNWKLYGVDELEAKIMSYKDEKKLLEGDHYDIPYADYSDLSKKEYDDGIPESERQYSGHTQSMHEKNYDRYVEIIYQLSTEYTDSCASALVTRKNEVSAIESENETIQAKRTEIQKASDKNSWKLDGYDAFTKEDLISLSKLYIDTDYTNENVIVVDNDTNTTNVNEQLRLYELAKNDLEIYSQPQYTYSNSIDNFLCDKEYKNYVRDLNYGNFIRVENEEGRFIKLRVIGVNYNPFIPNDQNLTLKYSNMIRTKSELNDYDYLLSNSTGGSKNSITGSSGSSDNSTETVKLTPGLLRKIFASNSSKNQISDIVNAQFNTLIGKYLNVDTIDTELVKAIDVKASNGFFQYLQAELISAGHIIADSGDFKKLSALVANIDNLLAGNVVAELAHIINLTADNVIISEAVIRDLIASQITVSMLKAGDISADSFHIVSDDGGMTIIGNTMQFKDNNGNVRIQIGRDAKDNFTFTLYDETGSGVLIDADGIKESAIEDGLIKTNMIGNQQVKSNNIDFADFGTHLDEEGNLITDIAHIVMNGEKFEVQYASMLDNQDKINKKLDSTISTLSKEIKSITLSGAAAFVKDVNGVITPASTTITAIAKNGAEVANWYLDGVMCTSYVSLDKTSITLPSSIFDGKKQIVVRAEDSTQKLFDTMTVYLLEDGRTGDTVLNAYVESSKGNTFDDNKYFMTTLTARIRDNSGLVDEDGTLYKYVWYTKKDDKWIVIGNGNSINIDNTDFENTSLYKFRAGNLASSVLVTADGNTVKTVTKEEIKLDYIDYSAVCFESAPVQLYKIHQGKDGIKGQDGKTTYFHVMYSPVPDPVSSQMTATPDKYIGTYVDYIADNSTDSTRYNWTQFKGDTGGQGIPGKNGDNGETSYLHMAYANSADGTTDFSTTDSLNKSYLGQYTDFILNDSSDPTKYKWTRIKGEQGLQGIQGIQGQKGEQGIPGEPGADGKTTYFHIKYSDSKTGNPMTETPATYIGTYVDFVATDSSDYTKYTWTRFSGLKGDQGIPGVSGEDGRTSYLHIAYANSENGSIDFSVSDSVGKMYIGQYIDFEPQDSTNSALYKWTKIKGEQGIPGIDGKTSYFHVKYSENADGNPLSEIPSTYIGTYVDFSEADSSDYNKYKWVRLEGVQGTQGIPGINGEDGKTSYLHIKYSDVQNPTLTSQMNETDGYYIGRYVDFELEDSEDPMKYTWSKFRGNDAVVLNISSSDGFTYEYESYFKTTLTAHMYVSNLETAIDEKYLCRWMQFINGKWTTIAGGVSLDIDSTDLTDVTRIKFQIGKETVFDLTDKSGDVVTTIDNSNISITTLDNDSIIESAEINIIEYRNGKDGYTPQKGIDYFDGEKGLDSHFYIRYSDNENGNGMYETPKSSTKYMGVVSTTLITAPTDYTKYTWSKIKGETGETGTPGGKGEDGISSYLHVKYSDDGKVFTNNNGETIGKWIGTCVTQYEADPSTFTDYTWKRFVGEDGHDGISVSKTTPYFALGTNTTVTGEWTTSFPVRNEGEFVWRKDLTMYSSGSSEFTDPYIVSGLDAESPVNVQLDNENESYNCGYNGSILSNITTVLTVIAHRGIKPITDISIGAIASPSGMAITKSANKVNITVLAGTSLADKGTVTIPIIIDNVSYNKVFSYSKVYNGNPGENVTVASLLNDSCTVTTDNNGENGIFTNCTTKMFVWEGIDDVTSGYTFTASTVGISGHFDSNIKNKYIVTFFDGTTENAYADITASKTGSQSLTKRFTVSMSKTGNPSVSYYISSTAQIIKQSQQNTLTPTVVTFSFMQKIGNSSASYALGYYKVYISDGTTLSIVESGHNSSVTYTPSAGNSYIKCEFYEDESCTKLLDEQTVPYILDGIDALRYVVTSSKGTVFKHGSLFATDLKCIIYQGDLEVDADGQYTYRWARMNEETSVYEVFNYGKEITETQDGFNMSDQIRVQFGSLENEVLIGKNGNPVTTKTGVQITTVSM